MMLDPLLEWAYSLTEEEVNFLGLLADQRDQYWMQNNNPTKRIGGKSDFDIHRVGALGEYAICKMLGMPFNWAWNTPDGHIDTVLYGRTVQIKTRPVGRDLLLFTNLDHFQADIAITAILDDETNTVVAAGWVGCKDFRRMYPEWPYGHEIVDLKRGVGDQPAIPSARMRKMDTLQPILLEAELRYKDDHEELQANTADEDDYTPDPVAQAEFQAIQRQLRHDREREERDRQELERQFVFNAQQARKKAWIESGADTRQPPEYRGRVFTRASKEGIHYDATPEMRDANHELTEEFIAFQAYHGSRMREEHPEYYCEECGDRWASVVCPYEGCRSARVRYPDDESHNYHCLTCRRGFVGERVCGPCISKRPEVQLRLQEEDLEKRKKAATKAAAKETKNTKGKIAYRPITELYPD